MPRVRRAIQAAYKGIAGAGRPPSLQLVAIFGTKLLLLPFDIVRNLGYTVPLILYLHWLYILHLKRH
jgi:hypothetical protein